MGGIWEGHGRGMGGAWEVGNGRDMEGTWEGNGKGMGGAWEGYGGEWEGVERYSGEESEESEGTEER